jgi:hypothetical protein
MTKTRIGAAAIALLASAAMFSFSAMAQSTQPCTGSATDDNGVIHSSGITAPGGWDGTCEAFVMPNGRVLVQNGPAATGPDGPDALHESK